jgi:hypothetical protein
MGNRLNFTGEMINKIRAWKGKTLKAYTENDDENYVTAVRVYVGEKVFDIANEYTAFEYPDKDIVELTCFSCIEKEKDSYFLQSVSNGKCIDRIIEETIKDIYIVTDKETGILFDADIPFELVFDTAIIIQTEKKCYALWRDIIFERIDTAICDSLEIALKTIRSVDEIKERAQCGNPNTITVERKVMAL